MKKILFVILLSVSLSASCEFWLKEFHASSKMLFYAVDRKAPKEVVAHAKDALGHIERAGVRCNLGDKIVEDAREMLKKTIVEFSQ